MSAVDQAVGAYVTELEEGKRLLENRLILAQTEVRAVAEIVDRSADSCPTLTEARGRLSDLLDTLGVAHG